MICASQNSVRDIMLGAQQIGVLNTGQYVFINLGKYDDYSCGMCQFLLYLDHIPKVLRRS